MKKIILFLLAAISFDIALAQEKLYNPLANAEQDIAAAVKEAKAEHKFVLIEAGGNWCKWCVEFGRLTKADHQIDSVIHVGYIVYHLNNSPENENKSMFSKLRYPQRFGFPVFIILDGDGQRLHTQNSEYLEDGKSSYDKNKVQSFLEMWSPHALDPHVWGD